MIEYQTKRRLYAFSDCQGATYMESMLTDVQQHLLRMIFDRGADGASHALSKWLAEDVHLAISEVELVELEAAGELLGPADSLVASCSMGLTGQLTGLILLIFENHAGFALVDLLLHQSIGTTTEWGELEQSAVKETTNIIGCAYVNALATYLRDIVFHPTDRAENTGAGELVPTPPTFVQEFAGSLLQFAPHGSGTRARSGLANPQSVWSSQAGIKAELDTPLYSKPRFTALTGCITDTT